MSFLDAAKGFQRRDLPVEAAEAYEAAYQAEGESFSLDDYLEVAVLYFVCDDYGYICAKKLPDAFARSAYSNAKLWLQRARARFGEHPEIRFWELYIDFKVLGEPTFEEECENLVATGETLIPYFYLHALREDHKYAEEARRVYDMVKGGCTSKERYIKSVLDRYFMANRGAEST